jgi:hypothetical protein
MRRLNIRSRIQNGQQFLLLPVPPVPVRTRRRATILAVPLPSPPMGALAQLDTTLTGRYPIDRVLGRGGMPTVVAGGGEVV